MIDYISTQICSTCILQFIHLVWCLDYVEIYQGNCILQAKLGSANRELLIGPSRCGADVPVVSDKRSSLNSFIETHLSGDTISCTPSGHGTYWQIKGSGVYLFFFNLYTQFSQVSQKQFNSARTLEQTAVTAVYWLCTSNWSRTDSQTACLSCCPTARDPRCNEPPTGPNAANVSLPQLIRDLPFLFSFFFFFGLLATFQDNYPASVHFEFSVTQLPPLEAGVSGKARLGGVICLYYDDKSGFFF